MQKKLHWTQTPAGRKKLSAQSKRLHREGKMGKKKSAQHSSTKGVSNHGAYLYGKVETIIEHYADGAGVPRAALAAEVASLLQHQARW